MNKPKAKAMTYALDITRRVPTAKTMRDGGTEKKAKALKGTWIRLNPEMFAFVEDAQTTIVEITKDTRGCGCKTFADSDLMLLCEHLIAFDALKEPPQMTINSDECKWLTEYLFGLGWYSDKDRWLYPSLDSPTRLDPMHEEKELDLGVGDADARISGDKKPTQKPSSNVDKREAIHYKCPKCGEEVDVEKDKLSDWKLNHITTERHLSATNGKQGYVKGVPDPSPTDDAMTKQQTDEMKKATSDPEGESNEGDDPTPNKPPEKTPVPKPGMMSTKCAWCGEKIERELAADLAQALDDHHKICSVRPKGSNIDEDVRAHAEEIVKDALDNMPIGSTGETIKSIASKEVVSKTGTTEKENKNMETKESKTPVIDTIKRYVGDDVLEIFGDTGSGKSKFALEIAREAIGAGLKVFYLDSERNLTDDDVKMLGSGYKYTPVLSEIDSTIRKLPAVDIVIIDSIGFPILTAYARYSMKQKGDALLTMIAMFGDLKQWAYRNNGLVIVVNQPESTFNKEAGHILRPFGDKSQFAAKEIWWLKMVKRADKTPDRHTEILITSFRGRTLGYGDKLYTMNIRGNGIEFISMR